MAAKIEKTAELNLYQNPIPHVRSLQATFPGLAKLPNGELIALFVIGEAFEAANSRAYVSRSADQGRTWTFQGELYDQTALGYDYQFSDCYKPTLLQNGSLIALGYGFERRDPNKGIGDIEGGFPPGRNTVCFSSDNGKTWTNPTTIELGIGQLETSGPAIQLASGRILAAAPVFHTGAADQKGLAIASEDNGKTWNQIGVFYQSSQGNIAPWETRICEMQPDRVVALFWAFDLATQQHLANMVTISHDGGQSWSDPIDTGHMGQASNMMYLGDDTLLTIHAHRAGDVGLYVRIVDLTDDRWNCRHEEVIWGKAPTQDTDSDIIDQFANLKFGQPSLLPLDDGDILAAHWCVEDGTYVIKTHRLKVTL